MLIDLVLNLFYLNENYLKILGVRLLKYFIFYGINSQINFLDVFFFLFGDLCFVEMFVVYIESEQFLVIIIWIVFFVIDNFGILFKVILNFKDLLYRMVEGLYVVIYIVIDMLGNKKFCSIIIEVVGKWVSRIKCSKW